MKYINIVLSSLFKSFELKEKERDHSDGRNSKSWHRVLFPIVSDILDNHILKFSGK